MQVSRELFAGLPLVLNVGLFWCVIDGRSGAEETWSDLANDRSEFEPHATAENLRYRFCDFLVAVRRCI